MSEESNPKKLSLVPHPCSTESTPIVPVSPCLPPQDIERFCKAFIRLLIAPERETYHDHQPNTTHRHTRN